MHLSNDTIAGPLTPLPKADSEGSCARASKHPTIAAYKLWAGLTTTPKHSHCALFFLVAVTLHTYEPHAEIPTYTHIMSDVAKPDPAAEQVANPAATLVKDETAKVTTDKAADKEEKPATTSTDDKPVTEKATEAATSAAAAVKDNVFSMFGGGPKKEKKEEADDADEPSGSSKAQAATGVRCQNCPVLCGDTD
jgi:hypothetical protein